MFFHGESYEHIEDPLERRNYITGKLKSFSAAITAAAEEGKVADRREEGSCSTATVERGIHEDDILELVVILKSMLQDCWSEIRKDTAKYLSSESARLPMSLITHLFDSLIKESVASTSITPWQNIHGALLGISAIGQIALKDGDIIDSDKKEAVQLLSLIHI